MKKFRIMIHDDDSEYVEDQKDYAYDKFNIELIHFPYWDEAYEELKINHHKYDGLILDAKGQQSKNSPEEDIDTLIVAYQDLKTLEGQNVYIPYVVCTGHEQDALPVTSPIARNDVKIKTKEDEMFKHLIEKIEGQQSYRIRKKFEDVFNIFDHKILSSSAEKYLLQALVYVESGDRSNKDEFFLNPMRKVLEAMFRSAIKHGLLPEKLDEDHLNQQHCRDLMSGNNVMFPHRSNHQFTLIPPKSHFPDLVRLSVEEILDVTNQKSHFKLTGSLDDLAALKDRVRFEEYSVSPYLLNAIVFKLLDVLLWYKLYLKDYPNIEKNKAEIKIIQAGKTRLKLQGKSSTL
jgi:hypothetical protein